MNRDERDGNYGAAQRGRSLCSEAEADARGFGDESSAQRRRVLRETVDAFERRGEHFATMANRNLERWKAGCRRTEAPPPVQVIAGDWGEVAQSLTKQYGTCFAVLNMANAEVPGGAYVEGAIAQEENMFRRTDCHFCFHSVEFDAITERYSSQMSALISGQGGRVYLDTARPRICIRGSERRTQADLGYDWLPDDQVFPFYELRAAAQDLWDGRPFDSHEGRRRIAAQLDTVKGYGLRHLILSAFGCGAFRNPPDVVARIYREEIQKRDGDFDLVAFAIFAPGYGPDNFSPFSEVFAPRSLGKQQFKGARI